jgi:murein DD-endopeptidase MepM/ murein hydrolase activator NlpD
MNRRQVFLSSFALLLPSAAFAQSAAASTTTVGNGETLFQIAERTRQPVRALIDANGLVPPYELKAGQVLRLPPAKVHIVKAGETIQDVAKRYSIDMRSLAVFNGLPKPYTVKLGQRINLPSLVRDRYTGLEPQDLAAVLSAEIARGKPVTGGPPPVSPTTRPPAPSTKTGSVAPPKTTIPGPSTKPPVSKTPTPPISPTKPTTQPPANPISPGQFTWPVRGDILLGFGPKPGGARNDGINIEAQEGTPFRAAADGQVAYVGNQLVGFGWLILIKHTSGFITAYAHASSVAVREGQSVRKGDLIGNVGATGRVNRPQLHFEIRQGTKPVDPLRFLRS